MLRLLKIKNVALIDELELEFGDGLNLLTGETGSGKSIIVDGLAALTGERISSDLIKQGADAARIEGLFFLSPDDVGAIFDEGGLEIGPDGETIVRREIAAAGKNRVFVNDRLVTQTFLKRLGPYLADIHGQGDERMLYDAATHLAMLDAAAAVDGERNATVEAYARMAAVRDELETLRQAENEKLQLVDILRFQIEEINSAAIAPGEDDELEAEKGRAANAERLAAASDEVSRLLYDDDASVLAVLDRAVRRVEELKEFDRSFNDFDEGIAAARATLSELAAAARAFNSKLEFSPGRLDEIENRLAVIDRLKRKYGESVESVLEHLERSRAKLDSIENADLREAELRRELDAAEAAYRNAAAALTKKRSDAAQKFAHAVESELRSVALEKARFEVRLTPAEPSPNGVDRAEFYFSANTGEPLRPLAKVASGGEASRLMLVIKTAAKAGKARGGAAVFDEVDVGIGGRVAEAVGRKLKTLATRQQVFCVTHQPQIASLADHHFLVEKSVGTRTTTVTVRQLTGSEKIDEIARMLAGEKITDAARENARAMLAAAK